MKAYLNFDIIELGGIYKTGCFALSPAPISSEVEISLPKGFETCDFVFGPGLTTPGIKYPDGTILPTASLLYTIHAKSRSIPAIPTVPDFMFPRRYRPIRLRYKVTRL